MRFRIPSLFLFLTILLPAPAAPGAGERPNIVLICADDLGRGDVSCYGGGGRIPTPNVDRLAREGVRFTDGHSTAATCTPSRYSLMTGEYAFRKKGTGILPGDAALIISPGRQTIASILKDAGYATGVVGKWHLGLGSGGVDWNKEITPGPREMGFGFSYIMAATGDRVPCVYVENGRVAGLDPADPISVSYAKPVGDWPTGQAHPELLKLHPSMGHSQTIVNGISRIGYMTGGKAALWKDEDMPDVFLRQAQAFMEKNKDTPFFLYYATHEPHVPRVPHPRFAGKSGLGARGDAVLQMDWSVGEVLATLDRLKLTEKTLVIFTSDNGPVVDDGYKDEAVALLGGHQPAGGLRGGKYSLFEAGTRVPFITRWPGRVKPGISPALVCQVDFAASFAALTGQSLNAATAPDSENVLPALLGDTPDGRSTLVEASDVLALREGNWKLLLSSKGARRSQGTNIELGNDPAPQLYDLTADPAEQQNLALAQPDRVAAMTRKLEEIKARGTLARDGGP